jgi:DNA polymerase-4
MDAFFASVELLERPELRGTPVIVGGGGNRGVVSAASYEAREFGVHSAMPMVRARRLCPQATVISPSHGKYGPISARVMGILGDITPEVEPLSLDEAFLDVSGALRRLGMGPAAIAAAIRRRVRDEEGLTCSVGVATTKYVAKVASSSAKPDGLLLVPADGVVDFLHPLPVGALWGVGDKAEAGLRRLGLHTVGDIAHCPPDALRDALGDALGARLTDLAWGRDPRQVDAHVPDKSIGAEVTFERDINDPVLLHRELLRLSEKVAARLRAAGLVGRTVSVKLRNADWRTVTRSRTLPEPTDVTRQIHTIACELQESGFARGTRLRLVGVRVEGLTGATDTVHQMLIDEPGAGWREADRAIDQAVRKFGQGAVRPAALVRREGADGSSSGGVGP